MIPKGRKRLAEDRPDCYWLYVLANCASTPHLHKSIKNLASFPWHEVTKV